MTEQGTGAPAPEATNSSSAPASEVQTSSAPAQTPASGETEKSPEALAREAELNDIADLLGQPLGEQESGKPAEDKDKKPDEKKEEKPISPAPSPGEEKKPESEAKPQQPQSEELANLLKEAIKCIKPDEPAKPEPKPEPEKAKYQPNLPDNLFAALEHDDPAVRRQGMNIMIGTAMSRVYADLKAEIATSVQTAISQVPQMVQVSQEQRDNATKSRDEFYSENPGFADKGPKFKEFVAMAGLQLAQEMQQAKTYKGFTPEFRGALAKRIEELTGGMVKAGKAPAPQQTTETKPAKPGGGNFQPNAGARPGGTGTPTLADEIAETIGFTTH